tara:strand:- start:132 stop:362 length:231 start_codon:yes stop_codon:yes gene_type:complete
MREINNLNKVEDKPGRYERKNGIDKVEEGKVLEKEGEGDGEEEEEDILVWNGEIFHNKEIGHDKNDGEVHSHPYLS